VLWEELEVKPEPEENPGPPPLPVNMLHPMAIPPLCDAFAEKSIYIWFRLVYDGTSDLDPEECGTDEIGGAPQWWVDEDDHSLDTIFSPTWTHTTHDGHEFPDKWLRWALEEGIAPGQPFLVCIKEPRYTRDYYGEYDVEYDVDIVRVMPRTPTQALRAWSRVLEKIHRYYDAFIEASEKLRALQDTDVSALSLATETCGFGTFRIYLCSKHSTWGQSRPWVARLTSGDDKDGDYRKAFLDLLRNTKRYRPGINLEAVLALADPERIRISRWEHLNLSLGTLPVESCPKEAT